MAKVPEPLHTTAALIYQAYENDADSGNRPHLGASLIGHACERYLWLTFRWVEDKKFDGRMLRLFQTGEREEARLVANLRRIGVQVHDKTPDGQQWRVSDIGGHFGGSMDGAALGLPEAPKTWHVLEFKTHNDKSFKELSKGVQSAKPQHYAQMQVYMGLTGMERAFYMAVNKNNDELYTERVEFDPVEFARLKSRAERVINAPEPPLKISQDPSWYVCKMCDFHEHCHGTAAPQVNCRTCANSTPLVDGEVGEWICESKRNTITIDDQRKGCSSHRYIPILLQNFATQSDYVNGDVIYTDKDGATFGNGENPGSLSSQDIRNLTEKSLAAGMAGLKKEIDEVFGPGSKVIA